MTETSLAERVARRLAEAKPAERPAKLARWLATVPAGEQILHQWAAYWRRPSQAPPLGEWRRWLMMAGRGSGKTRTAAEWCLDRSVEYSERGVEHRGALIGPTVDTTRDVMVLGESGMLACAERRGIPTEYLPTNRLLLFPTLNSRWQTYSAEKPDQLRGPAHHTAWLEEIASWRFLADAKGNSALMNTDLGLRLQPDPRMILTTTPKPIEPIRDLVRDAEAGARGVVLTRGSTFENARNLAPQFIEAILARYEGTRLGAQEIHGILLDNVEGALWTVDMIEAGRVGGYPDLERIIVAVDPPAETAECGIVVVGSEHSTDRLRGHAYVLDDTSLAATPELWGRTVVDTYRKWDADAVVAEVNQGGDMVRAIIHAVDPSVPVKPVRAAIGKAPRAEPVVALFEQGRVHMVGYFGDLESQLVTWVPGDTSPDRLDALVWGVRFLFPSMTQAPAQVTSLTRREGASWQPGR